MSAPTSRPRPPRARGARRAGSGARRSPQSRRRRVSPPCSADSGPRGGPRGGAARGRLPGRRGQPAPGAPRRQGATASRGTSRSSPPAVDHEALPRLVARDGLLTMPTRARNQRHALWQRPTVAAGMCQHRDALIADLDRRIAALVALSTAVLKEGARAGMPGSTAGARPPAPTSIPLANSVPAPRYTIATRKRSIAA